MDEAIHCVFAIDANYCQHVSVVFASILANAPASRFHFHLVHIGVGKRDLLLLQDQVASRSGSRLSVYDIEAFDLTGFRVDRHISLATYFRLLLPSILPPEIDKVIYLDGDIVVLADLGELWRLDIGGRLMAAAPDLFMGDEPHVSLDPGQVYFNAGVLVIDLAGWRRKATSEALVQFARQNRDSVYFHDQDTLNAVLGKDVFHLDYRWNFHARTLTELKKPEHANSANAALRAARPFIVHYTTQEKPWIYGYDAPFEGEYYQYLGLTPWRGFTPPDRTPRAILRRYARRHAPSLVRLYARLRGLPADNL